MYVHVAWSAHILESSSCKTKSLYSYSLPVPSNRYFTFCHSKSDYWRGLMLIEDIMLAFGVWFILCHEVYLWFHDSLPLQSECPILFIRSPH